MSNISFFLQCHCFFNQIFLSACISKQVRQLENKPPTQYKLMFCTQGRKVIGRYVLRADIRGVQGPSFNYFFGIITVYQHSTYLQMIPSLSMSARLNSSRHISSLSMIITDSLPFSQIKSLLTFFT